MTDLKISQMPAATSVAGGDIVPIVQGGTNKTASIDLINKASLTPTINTQTGTSYLLQTVDNDGKTYLRMTSSSANTVTIPSNQTLPISITQRGTGTTTLVADSGVTLNGTLAFSAQHQTKSVIPVGSNAFDVVG